MANKKEDNKPSSVIAGELRTKFDEARALYSKDFRRIKILDAIDDGDLWSAIGAKYPPYQLLPDTNHTSYIRANILASIYTVAKSAEIEPTSDKDKDIVTHLNLAMQHIWTTAKVGYYQFCAGDWAALVNLGITQVGWSKNAWTGKDDIALKNIEPLKFMRDPAATSLDTAEWCCTYDVYHKTFFTSDKRYKEKFAEYAQRSSGSSLNIPEINGAVPRSAREDYYTLVIFWFRREDGSVDEIHTINIEEVLYEKKDIKPSCFPFAQLYCNTPRGGRLIGTSECGKALANSVVANIMDSIGATAEYKNQRPPKFVSEGSGLNTHAFLKHGNDADYTFVVQGDASKAVHYQQYPLVSPQLLNIRNNLELGLQKVSGIDDRYTGRNTGSIITTGGIEDMLNRVTVIDTPKIMNYEEYTAQVTKLILYNFLEYAPKRAYFLKDLRTNKWRGGEVDFPKLDKETVFNYACHISSELPKNKQRVAEMATVIMEKQMQYQQAGNQSVELITPEEWLMLQDLPYKELFLERMNIDRLNNEVEDVAQTLAEYSKLYESGMSPEDALLATAKSMSDKRRGIPQEESPMPIAGPEGAMGGMPMGMPGGEPGGLMQDGTLPIA